MSFKSNNHKWSTMKTFNIKIEKTIVFVIVLTLFSATTIFAQERDQYELYSLEQITEGNNLRSALPSYIKPENINPLISELKPSIYMRGGVIQNQSENAVRAYLDLNSLNSTINRIPAYDNVELVVIYIENMSELSGRINLDNLSGFTKLKYVQIVCRVNCNQNQISNALISTAKNYVVIYSVEIES